MLRVTLDKHPQREGGALSSLQTLVVATATRVGMGNLVGVVAAISAGGAGAVFWMWITALIGSSTAFVEATLAQLHKEKDPLYGGYRGGPAYFIRDFFAARHPESAKKRRCPMAVFFAISGLICWCGISQVIGNSVSSAFYNAFSIPPLYTTIILVVIAAVIVLRRNATVKVLDLVVPHHGRLLFLFDHLPDYQKCFFAARGLLPDLPGGLRTASGCGRRLRCGAHERRQARALLQ